MNLRDNVVEYFYRLQFFYIFNFDVCDNRDVLLFKAKEIHLRRFAVNLYFEMSSKIILYKLFCCYSVFWLQNIQFGFFSLRPNTELKFICKNARCNLQGF